MPILFGVVIANDGFGIKEVKEETLKMKFEWDEELSPAMMKSFKSAVVQRNRKKNA